MAEEFVLTGVGSPMWQREPKFFWRYFRVIGDDTLYVEDLRMKGTEYQDEYPYVWYINQGDEHSARSMSEAKGCAEMAQSVQESFRREQGK